MEQYKKVLNYAGNAAGYRQLSEKELHDKIMKKGFSEQEAQYAVETMRKYKGVDDEQYAHTMTEQMAQRGFGKGRIVQKLRQKGIDTEHTQAALEDFTPDYAQMERYIRSKITVENPDRALLKKVSDGLMRKGFSWDEIKKALRNHLDDSDFE